MLDQNTTTLLAALIGGLLSAIGGFFANYYIQSSSDRVQKKKEIRNLVEQIYKIMNNIKYALRDLGTNSDTQYKGIIDITSNLDDIDRRVHLYLHPLKNDFSEYKSNIKNIMEKAIDKANKKSTMPVDINTLQDAEEKFRLSLLNLLKRRGYNYF